MNMNLLTLGLINVYVGSGMFNILKTQYKFCIEEMRYCEYTDQDKNVPFHIRQTLVKLDNLSRTRLYKNDGFKIYLYVNNNTVNEVKLIIDPYVDEGRKRVIEISMGKTINYVKTLSDIDDNRNIRYDDLEWSELVFAVEDLMNFLD